MYLKARSYFHLRRHYGERRAEFDAPYAAQRHRQEMRRNHRPSSASAALLRAPPKKLMRESGVAAGDGKLAVNEGGGRESSRVISARGWLEVSAGIINAINSASGMSATIIINERRGIVASWHRNDAGMTNENRWQKYDRARG